MLRTSAIATTAALILLAAPTVASAQAAAREPQRDTANANTDLERRAHLARRGGGVRVGMWDVRALTAPSGAKVSVTPVFEGYVRRGLDLHLALEHSIGVWRRTQTVTQSGGPLGGSTQSTAESYVIPQFTSIAFFPLTRPHQRFEPFVKAGAGFALGIEDRSGDAGGLFGGTGTSLVPGYGLTGGAGMEVRLSSAVGLAATGRYNWVRFLQDFGGRRTYEGFGAEVGVTYRFQFR
jgi:opacity protein-like surface antigen